MVTMLTSVMFSLTVHFLRTSECERIVTLINTLFYLILFLVGMLKLVLFWWKSSEIKQLIEMMRMDSRLLSNREEHQILLKKRNEGRFICVIFAYILYLVSCSCVYLTITKSSDMDICQSLSTHLPSAEYITNDNTYSFLIRYFTIISFALLTIVLAGTETMTIMCSHHAAGLFEVIW
ncbi:uncharacterized protein LOC113464247 [Ceratina calcarata]|uniref:Uncharacterized protein LOC113464247 n=1 Tax=Ceratina calcarata TaxID=156304 RepID=A0AAJ7WAZ5_9HYME|nr:uncharacterized protein LOC113464247 [Ceratina calcarata]